MLRRFVPVLTVAVALSHGAAGSTDDLGGLLWAADRIALVEVTGVERVPVVGDIGPPSARPRWQVEVATLVIEDMFVGPEHEATLLALSTDSKRGPEQCRLAAGDRAIVFLFDISRSYGRTCKEERHALERWSPERSVWVPCTRGIWFIDRPSEEVRVPTALELDRARPGRLPWSEEEWIAEIEKVLASSLPCLDVGESATVIEPRQLRLFADGRYEGTVSGKLDESLTDGYFRQVGAWRDWPAELGLPSRSPCLAWTTFTLHERTGTLRILVLASSKLPPDEVEAARVQEANALWRSLPWPRSAR